MKRWMWWGSWLPSALGIFIILTSARWKLTRSPFYVAEGKSYLTIAIGCTGGRHRSVMIAERLRKSLVSVAAAQIRVRHRDIGHPS